MGAKNALLAVRRTYIDNNSVSNKEQLGYAGGIFGNAMGQDSVGTFADKFNRNFMGLSNAMLTVQGNISTILSFIVPPVAGTLYDTPAKQGKRSNIFKALYIMPVPFAISSMLLFIVPTSSVVYNFIWTLFLTILFSTVDTFYDIALNALALKMVSDPDDRKKFFTFESIASTMGSMLPGSLIPVIVGMTDDARRQQWLYFFVALGFCIIGVAAMYAPYMTIKERVSFNAGAAAAASGETPEKVKWDRNSIKAILHNRPFVILQLATVCEVIRQITYSILPYLYDDTFGDYKMKAIIDTVSGSLSYVGLLAVPFIGKRLSAKGMLVGGYCYTSFFYAIMSLFNINFSVEKIRRLRYIPGMCIGFAGVPNAAQGAARKIIVADSTDYMEWYSEKNFGTANRSDGLICATQNIVAKFNSLLKTNLYNAMFHLIGYKTNDLSGSKPVQSNSTLRGIYAVATLCGLIGNSLAALCFLFDNFNGERKEKVYAELAEMRKIREEKLRLVTEGTVENEG